MTFHNDDGEPCIMLYSWWAQCYRRSETGGYVALGPALLEETLGHLHCCNFDIDLLVAGTVQTSAAARGLV